MRTEPNLMLRGSTWGLRIAVPKALRELRVKAGVPTGQREIWRSLDTSDSQAARLKVAEAKVEVLRAFKEETAQLTLALNRPPRVPPTEFQLEQAVFAFKAQ